MSLFAWNPPRNARLGYALANPALVQVMTNTKAPYNISKPTATLALSSLSSSGLSVLRSNVLKLNASRSQLIQSLTAIPSIGRVLGGNDANFVLVEVLDGPKPDGKPSNERAMAAYKKMAEELGVVVRFRGNELGCKGCLRITVGTEKECEVVVQRLKDFLQ
jgi:histidinol-phosphate aminotransferase